MKIITITWKDGSKTSITVHATTDVLAAYTPVLAHIESITATDMSGGKAEVLYRG